MSASTSACGRFQFSLLNAKSDNTGISYSMQCLIKPLTASVPRLCPAIRVRPWELAHRPLPSMITATCFGFGEISAMSLDSLVWLNPNSALILANMRKSDSKRLKFPLLFPSLSHQFERRIYRLKIALNRLLVFPRLH